MSAEVAHARRTPQSSGQGRTPEEAVEQTPGSMPAASVTGWVLRSVVVLSAAAVLTVAGMGLAYLLVRAIEA